MERKILKVYKPGAIVEGIYQSCGDKFGFLITDEFHEDVYISCLLYTSPSPRDRG